MPSKELGPEMLIEAAALLMDERGIDEVSTNEIIRASGHRNRSAITYHFGSRDELVRAVIQPTMDEINSERNALLDHLESPGRELSERTIMEVVVGPLARQLRTPEGRRYVRLCAQVLDHPRFVTDAREAIWINSGVVRCAQYMRPVLAHLPDAIRIERASQVVGFLMRCCADQARLLDADPPPRPPLDFERFSANLVDMLLAMLLAPTSATAMSVPKPVPT